MKIVCPNCDVSYELAAAAVGASGRSVRCVRCRSVWFVEPRHEEPALAPAAAIAAPVPVPAAAPAGGAGALDDMAAWGLTDAGAEDPPAAAGAPAAVPFDQGADMFSMDSMMADARGGIALPDSPPLVPVDDWQGLGDDFGALPGGDGGVNQPRKRPDNANPKRSLRPPSMPTVVLALLAVLTALLGWRADVVRVMPQTASLFAAIGLPVNLRGLAFQDVKTTKELQDGVPVLVVEGRIVNISKLMLEVPRIRFAMRNAAGNEVYNWTTLPTRPILPPNAEQPFRTRLASPPAEGREVVVRFFNRRDAISGLR